MILYFSSSFIEEEHYIRYFIFSLIILYLYINCYPTDSICFQKLFKILLIHRVASSFNQTGDKWSKLRDTNDSINEYHLTWIAAILGIFLVHKFVEQSGRSNSSSLSFKIALGFIYLSKAIDSFSSHLGTLLFQ
jgi:GPI ethanolamine phosphate transferase-like protein